MLVYWFLLNRNNGRDFCDQRRHRYLLLNLLNLLLNLRFPFRLDLSDQLHWWWWKRNGYNLRLGSRVQRIIVQCNLVLAAKVGGKCLQPKGKIRSEYQFIIILDETLMYGLGMHAEFIEHGVGGE